MFRQCFQFVSIVVQFQPSFVSLLERLERERLGERNFVNDDAQYFTIPENFQSGEKQKRNIFLPQNVKNQL